MAVYTGRSYNRPTRHMFSWFFHLQATAEMVPKIPSCYCVLLMQTSRFKFIRINPLALKLNFQIMLVFKFTVDLLIHGLVLQNLFPFSDFTSIIW